MVDSAEFDEEAYRQAFFNALDAQDEVAMGKRFFRALETHNQPKEAIMLTRLRHAWLVLTGKLAAIDHSIIQHIDLTKSDLTQDARDILMSLSEDIAALGTLLGNAIASAKSDAANAVATAQASEAAAVTKATDLQSQLDAATSAVHALAAQLSPPPVA